MTLIQDNKEKLQVEISEENLLLELKSFFGWKKLSYERFKKLGSFDYDNFIEHLYKKRKYCLSVFDLNKNKAKNLSVSSFLNQFD